LQELTHGPVDLVVLSHPHLDHLGGLERAMATVGVKRFMDVPLDHPSRAYLRLLRFVLAHDVARVHPTLGDSDPGGFVTVGLGGGASLQVLWPRQPKEPLLSGSRSDVNANSIVARLTYGDTSFLFSGDAEAVTESTILAGGAELGSTVLKVGHHGSHYSSTGPWLAAIHPKAAVVSCGAGNEFGHPAADTMEHLRTLGAHVFRTDEDGEVTAVSDGKAVVIQGERGQVAPFRVEGKDGRSLRSGVSATAPVRGAANGAPEGRTSAGLH
jgi:beta-lactamase superfamily II metal-dependent hydrolase